MTKQGIVFTLHCVMKEVSRLSLCCSRILKVNNNLEHKLERHQYKEDRKVDYFSNIVNYLERDLPSYRRRKFPLRRDTAKRRVKCCDISDGVAISGRK